VTPLKASPKKPRNKILNHTSIEKKKLRKIINKKNNAKQNK
jgi:hypothetical protein